MHQNKLQIVKGDKGIIKTNNKMKLYKCPSALNTIDMPSNNEEKIVVFICGKQTKLREKVTR